MQDYGHVLCLFCKTGKEQSVAHRISENGLGTAIFPQRISKRYSKALKTYEEIRTALLPGYVFVYLPDEVPPVNWWTYSGVIRPLGYGEGRRDYLTGSDLAFAQWVWEKEGNISRVKVMTVSRSMTQTALSVSLSSITLLIFVSLWTILTGSSPRSWRSSSTST